MIKEILIRKLEDTGKSLFTKEDIIEILNETSRPPIASGNVIIKPENYTISVDGKDHLVPKKIFELSYYLMSNKNKMMKRDNIINMVWGTDVIVGHRTIDVHIRKIRMITGDRIKTVKTQGYSWVEN